MKKEQSDCHCPQLITFFEDFIVLGSLRSLFIVSLQLRRFHFNHSISKQLKAFLCDLSGRLHCNVLTFHRPYCLFKQLHLDTLALPSLVLRLGAIFLIHRSRCIALIPYFTRP